MILNVECTGKRSQQSRSRKVSHWKAILAQTPSGGYFRLGLFSKWLALSLRWLTMDIKQVRIKWPDVSFTVCHSGVKKKTTQNNPSCILFWNLCVQCPHFICCDSSQLLLPNCRQAMPATRPPKKTSSLKCFVLFALQCLCRRPVPKILPNNSNVGRRFWYCLAVWKKMDGRRKQQPLLLYYY